MKGARPRGKHDTQLARSGDQLVKVSGVDKIGMIALRYREEQEAKAQQKRLAEIRNIVRRLRQCCWPREFRWPDKNDLERLGDLVLYLFFRIRKRRPLHRWKCYKSVDDYWHLRLWQTLSNLVDRAASNTPRRPLEDYDRRLTRKGLAEKAKEFCRYYRQIVRGRDHFTVSWEQFDELFKSVLHENISSTVPLTSRPGERRESSCIPNAMPSFFLGGEPIRILRLDNPSGSVAAASRMTATPCCYTHAAASTSNELD